MSHELTPDTIPTICIGLRPDGALCIVLPGAFGNERWPVIHGDTLARTLREILEAQRDDASQRRIAGAAEPTQQQLEHRSHSSPSKGCPYCLAEAMVAAIAKGEVIPRRAQTQRIARHGDVEIRRQSPSHYCECGFRGSYKELAQHLAEFVPGFPRPAPKGFPHREVSASAASATQMLKRPEWRKLHSKEGKKVVEDL